MESAVVEDAEKEGKKKPRKTNWKKKSTIELECGKKVNIVWQPKYLSSKPCFWLLKSKTKDYDEEHPTVLVAFFKDTQYNLNEKIYRIKGGIGAVYECPSFRHEETGYEYIEIPLGMLVEVSDLSLPPDFVEASRKEMEVKDVVEDDLS